MKVAIAGITGFRNRGVEALALPILSFLLERNPDSHVTVLSWTPDYDQQRISCLKVDLLATSFRRFTTQKVATSKKQFLLNALKGILRPPFNVSASNDLVDPKLAGQLRDCQLLIITGGDVYSSEYGFDSLRYYLSLIHTAASEGLSIALVGHTVGKFNDPSHENAWCEAVKHVDLLTTRDRLTYEYLVNIGGLSRHTEICADVAFTLPIADPLPTLGIGLEGRPIIGMAVSAGLHRWCSLTPKQHREAWDHLIAHCLDELSADIMLIPHVQEPYGDDRSLVTALHRNTGFNPRIAVLGQDMSASEFKGLIAGCQLLIAERMHAAIAGISSQVPTGIVAYSLKANALTAMAYEGLEPSSQQMVIHTDHLLTPSTFVSAVHSLWQGREASSVALRRNLPQLKQLAQSNFIYLEQLLQDLVSE